jgi:hypothetical protein
MTTHHCPPEPGAIRSIVAPHMGVLGTVRDMLSQDLQMATRLTLAAEGEAEDALADWQHSHGPARDNRRRVARLAVVRLRERRRISREALHRLAAHTPATANKDAA